MALIHWKKNGGLASIGAKKSKNMQLPGVPTLASMESLVIPLVQEVVFLADFRCANCQQRVAEVMAKMSGETESVVVDVFDKKVTLTCRIIPTPVKVPSRHVTPTTSWISLNKVAPIRRLFLSSCS